MTRRKTTWTELAWNTFVCLALSPPAILATTIAIFVLVQVVNFSYQMLAHPAGVIIEFQNSTPAQVSPPPFTPPQINTLDNQELPDNQLPIPLIVTNPYVNSPGQHVTEVSLADDEDIKFLCLAQQLNYRGECTATTRNPVYDPRTVFDLGFLGPGESIPPGTWVRVAKAGCRFQVIRREDPYMPSSATQAYRHGRLGHGR